MAWWRWSTDARGGAASGILGDLLEVFQPSRHHLVEEQDRRRHHAQLPESGGPGTSDVEVDLDAGVAYLPTPVRPDGSRDQGLADAPRKVDRPARGARRRRSP
jgi:hypothetical protein